jgi:hypothetical protein
LAWFITGLLVAAHCQLTRIAPHLPWDGERDSVIQRLRRIVLNPRLEVRTLYGPTVGCLLRWLNGSHSIVVVVDRTYQDMALQTFVRDMLGWHFVQRLDQSTWAFPVCSRKFKLNASGLQPGQYRSFGRVRITPQRFGTVELIGFWVQGKDEPWYLISDRTLGQRAVRIYHKRFWIEARFRDLSRTIGTWNKLGSCLPRACNVFCCSSLWRMCGWSTSACKA